MNVLVVPTIREDCIHEFLNAWDILNWEIIVVEDNPKPTFRLLGDAKRFSWEDIDKELGNRSWIISRHDTAIKSFGFWKAYQMGADYIFTLDDDCMPVDGVLHIEEHFDNLENTVRWTRSVPGQRTRGIPYHNQGHADNVALSVGLWTGVPDFDSVYTLGSSPGEIELPKYNQLVARGQYFPMCGMNLCFKREITPLMYFPLMGDGQPYRRFDDIWCGIIAKKIMDHLNLLVSVGKPFIHHKKASNVFTNLVKEAPGIATNENFWETIDGIDLTETSVLGCMIETGEELEKSDDAYLKKLGQAVLTWCSLFSTP